VLTCQRLRAKSNLRYESLFALSSTKGVEYKKHSCVKVYSPLIVGQVLYTRFWVGRADLSGEREKASSLRRKGGAAFVYKREEEGVKETGEDANWERSQKERVETRFFSLADAVVVVVCG